MSASAPSKRWDLLHRASALVSLGLLLATWQALPSNALTPAVTPSPIPVEAELKCVGVGICRESTNATLRDCSDGQECTTTCDRYGRCTLNNHGTVECGSDQDCFKRCVKDESDNDVCRVASAGALCRTDEECATPLSCSLDGECTDNPSGLRPCSPQSPCRKYCNPDGTCSVSGLGAACSSASECTTLRCSSLPGMPSCVVGGDGPTCSVHGDCGRYRCTNDGRCTTGGSGRKCSGDGDESCPTLVKACRSGACAVVEPGEPIGLPCVVDRECQPSFYTTCQKGKCVKVTGEGISSCSGDRDCSTYTCSGKGACRAGINGGQLCDPAKAGQCPKITPVPGITPPVKEDSLPIGRYRLNPDSLPIKVRDPEAAARDLTILNGVDAVGKFGTFTPKVVLDVFHDTACGMCTKAWRTLLEPLSRDAKRRTQIRVREFPLIVSDESIAGAVASKCAAAYRNFKEYLNLTYGGTDRTSRTLTAHAMTASKGRAAACLAGGKTRDAVLADRKLGESLGVDGTPTFFVNGVRHEGISDPEEILALIDSTAGAS